MNLQAPGGNPQAPGGNSQVPAGRWRWRWRHAGYATAAIVVLGTVVFSALLWYLSTPAFVARVHRKVVATLERAMGGRVEIGSFHWSVRHLAIEVDGLTIHGKESPGQAPYLHVDHLMLHAKIVSFFSPRIGLASLTVQSPALHLILYPDGTTNQPQPRIASKASLPLTLLDLEIDNTRIQNGWILLNDRAIPWEMAAGPLQLTMRYVAGKKEYLASLHTENLTFRLKNATEAHSQLTANIDLTPDAVQIENLDLQTGRSHLAVTGGLQDFANPIWRMSVDGAVDAREIGAITGVDDLRKGNVRLAIQARGGAQPAKHVSASTGHAAGNFQVSGHVDLRSGEWESSWLRLRNVELHTNVIVDNDQCSLTDFSTILADQGKIQGSLIMKHCIGPSKPKIGPARVGPRELTSKARPPSAAGSRHQASRIRDLLARLRGKHAKPVSVGNTEPMYQPLEATLQAHVSGVTLPLILGAVARPYTDIGFTTAASGEVTGHWTGDGNGLVVRGILTMRPPRKLMGLIPVSGSTHAAYLGDHRHLVIDQVDVATPGTEVHASGTLTLLEKDRTSALHMDAVGRDLGEFDELLTILDLRETPAGQPHDLPVNLLGNASFHGEVTGSFFALGAVGHMDAQQFQVVIAHAAPTTPGVQVQPTRLLTWDQFHGDLNYSPSQLIVRNGVLARGNTVIHAALDLLPDRTAPDTYTYNKRTHIVASMQTSHVSIGELQSVLGTSYPVSGTLAANAHAMGTIDDLQGAGEVALTHGVVEGQPIDKASVQLAARGHAINLTHFQVGTADGTAAGQLSYDYETDELSGELTGQGFALGQIAALETQRSKIGGGLSSRVGGTVGFHVQAAGTTKSPIMSGALQIEDMSLDHVPMGRLHAEAHLQRGTLYVTSRADLLKTHVDAAGQVRLSGNDPAQLELTFAGFNVDPLLRLMTPSGITASSSLQGRITMSGPLKQLSAIQADANLNAFTATVGSLPIHSDGPMQMSIRNGMLELKQLHIRGNNVDFVAAGTVDLLKNHKLRLHSEGSIDVALARMLNRNLQSSGEIRFFVDARGTTRQPDLRGRAQLSHITVHMLNVTNGLTDMNGEMLFNQDRLVVQKLTGNSGGGELRIAGFLGYRNGLFADLTATTKDVRIRYPKGVSSTANAKLRLVGTMDSMLLNGNVEIMRFGISSNVDLASLAGGGAPAPIDPSSPLNRVRLDVHVTSAPELGFQNSFASLAGDINLRIRGTLEDPSVLGRVDITQGSATFAGTTYKLQQGDIVFANPVTVSPQIDLEASARVQNYDIIISLHGPPSKLDISYRSEPPLTQADVLALLALGRTNEQATMYGEQQQQGANLTSEALLGGALNAAVSNRVQKLFGVSSVRVDPNFVGALGESTARVTVGEQVGKNLTLTFATNVNTTAQQLIQAQYDLTQSVSIIAVRDEADVFSMYLQIRGRHK